MDELPTAIEKLKEEPTTYTEDETETTSPPLTLQQKLDSIIGECQASCRPK